MKGREVPWHLRRYASCESGTARSMMHASLTRRRRANALMRRFFARRMLRFSGRSGVQQATFDAAGARKLCSRLVYCRQRGERGQRGENPYCYVRCFAYAQFYSLFFPFFAKNILTIRVLLPLPPLLPLSL